MSKFFHQKTYDGQWEVIMQNHKGGLKFRHPRRLCLCTHEDDAKCIAEAMELYEENERSVKAEYYEGRSK